MSSNSSANNSPIWRPSFAVFWQKWIRTFAEYYILPEVIAAYFGIHIWFIVYFYAWRRLLWTCMVADDREVNYDTHHCEPKKAIILLTLEGILTLLTVLPWYYCFVVANIWARWFVKMPIWGRQKQIYQVNWDTGLSRSCHRCLGHPAMPPRWYHMSSLGMEQCPPLYDHTCPWLGAAVYLHNLKAYVLAVTLLPLHFLTPLVFSIFGLVENPHNRFTALIVFLMLASLLFAIPVATGTTARVWSEVIFLNRVMPERDGVGVRTYPDPYNIDDYKDQVYGPIPQDQILRKEGPFNRGTLANMRSLLGWNGSWWKVPAWMFLEPPVGRKIYLDEDHAQFWEPLIYFDRDQAVNARQERSTQAEEEEEAFEEDAPIQSTPQSTHTTLARLMPATFHRRNFGSDDHELDMV